MKETSRSLEGEEQRRRPPPVAETGRSCWGRGQQDASESEADAGCRNPDFLYNLTEVSNLLIVILTLLGLIVDVIRLTFEVMTKTSQKKNDDNKKD